MKHIAQGLLAGIAAVTLAVPVAATTYLFSYTGSFTASWELPASPTPEWSGPTVFRIGGVNMIIDGAPVTDPHEYYVTSAGGGVCAGEFCGVLDLFGPQLFSGTTAAPTFLLGSFAMEDFLGAPIGTLTIAERSAGGVIPEPATWALLIAGFGLTGASLRRRRNSPA